MNTEEFDDLLSQYEKIKEKRVDSRLKFYNKWVDSKRRAAETSRAAILLLSLVIPVVANIDFTASRKGITISILSLLIAFISGFSEIHQWQRNWREYSKAIVQIEGLIGLWEIEVTKTRLKAGQLPDPKEVKEISGQLARATDILLESVEKIVLTEMQAFFATAVKAPKGTSKEE